jgi:redox-sensitive bicupin YhaK (pirin superfamily)
MKTQRKLDRIYNPPKSQGFLGAGHVAASVIQGGFQDSDPFIFLMDDQLDKKDNIPVGGPHPHAGFETVSLLLEGEFGDGERGMKAGDFQIMTAGSGIVHTETIEKQARLRVLQLWLTLPKKNRWTTPRVQDVSLERAPKVEREGFRLRLYSGELAGIKSPILNYTPLIVADVSVDPNSSISFQIPGHFSTFIYLIDGTAKVGKDMKDISEGQVGWLDRSSYKFDSELNISTASSSVRFILYSAEPQGEPIVSHGPFIADNREDISRLYNEYRQGKMGHISSVKDEQKIKW